MQDYRELLRNGYRDGVEQSGAGFAPTYPGNEPYPPLITIDHVVTRNAIVSSIHSATISRFGPPRANRHRRGTGGPDSGSRP